MGHLVEISPQYTGDGAYDGTTPRGGLDREWRLLKDAMADRKISSSAEAQAKTRALDELSGLLDARQASIQNSLSPQLLAMTDSINRVLAALVEMSTALGDLGQRVNDVELHLLQIDGDLETIRMKLPPDASTGTSNARPAGRDYQTVVVNG